MTYISLQYALLVAVMAILYYILPSKYRWCSLLLGSIIFYVLAVTRKIEIIIFVLCIVISYIFGRILEKKKNPILLALGIFLTSFPLLYARISGMIPTFSEMMKVSVIIPIGLSFWSMQMIAYLVDIYKGKVHNQNHFLKYVLFMSFFPQIIQGPIPRYSEMEKQLYRGHKYQRDSFVGGLQLILFGLFLKFMIADKAGIVVDQVFSDVWLYQGVYGWVAGILYSFQLYADFLSCTVISIGTASLFGITLKDNFNHPYFSTSIAEFWRRWHMSFSSWLKDYIYIPLGGSRKGEVRRCINILITFIVSGIWHGMGIKFLVWGLLHGFYQIFGKLIEPFRNRLIHNDAFGKHVQMIITFILVMFGWIIFRADTLSDAIVLLRSMFQVWNPWVLLDGSFEQIGFSYGEWVILIVSMIGLYFVSKKQEEGVQIRKWFASQHIVVRWSLLIVLITVIWIFGTYGYGFSAQDFIYGGF